MQDPGEHRAKRPFDTRISVAANPGGLEIVVPPVRMGLGHVVAVLFIAVFCGIPWVATSHGGPSARLFGLPFWAIGAALTYSLLLSLVQTTRITVGPQTTVLGRRPLGSRRSLATAEIVVRVGRRASRSDDGRPGPQMLLLEYGTKTYYLLSGYSDQEQRWVADQLGEWLESVQRA